MKKYAYYPGCSLSALANEYDVSFRNVCERLGIVLEEIPGWLCCGAIAACSASRLFGVTLPLKNAALALENGHTQIVAPCSACFFHLKSALHQVETDPAVRKDAEDVLGVTFDRPIEVLHPLQILSEHIDSSLLKRTILRNYSHVKVACYYGCLLTRPGKVMKFDSVENPQTMDRLLRAVEFTTVDWSYKTDCCGAFYASVKPEVVVDLTYRILENALATGAGAIAVACPICHLNLDTRQSEVEQKYGTKYNLPIFYFTQLMAAAIGIDESGIGLWRHVVDAEQLIRMNP